ncbi:MAG: sulfite exporter TauE/SafE family protein, partial [Terracidiphilus sp.]
MLIPAAHPLVHWQLLWLVLAAFFGGVLNAVAGGGSFLLFPAMLGTGMLPVHANATNTVALWPGQLTSIAAYRDDMRRHLRLAVLMGVAGLIGGTAGALVLLSTPQRTFMALVPWLLLVAATIFALSRPATRWLEGR